MEVADGHRSRTKQLHSTRQQNTISPSKKREGKKKTLLNCPAAKHLPPTAGGRLGHKLRAAFLFSIHFLDQ